MKRTNLQTIILTCLLYLAALTDSHAVINVRSRFLSSENGLKANYIRGIVQDSRGYIWMGSTAGLIRYDGYTAELITPDDSENRRLMLDERVLAIDIWQGRFVWLMTRDRKYACYDTLTDTFVDFTGDGSYEENYHYYHILSNGDIWLSDKKNGCKVIHYDGKHFSSRKEPLDRLPVEAKPSLPSQYASLLAPGRDLIRDNQGNLIVTSNEGDLWHVSLKRQQVTHLTGIYSRELFRLNGTPRYSVVTDRDGIIWISTYGNGLFAHDPQTGETVHFLSDGSTITPIQTNYLLKLYEDKAGNLWACQENMGVAIISKQNANISSLYFTTKERLDHTNSIHLLTRAGEHIYIGNRYNGLKMADDLLNNISDASFTSDDVVAVCTDLQETRWMGAREKGVYAGTQNLCHQADDPHSLSPGKISDIICDQKGRIWISIFDGALDLAEPDGKGGYRFRHFFAGKDAITHPRKMLVDHAGYIWLCSDEGLYAFHPDQLIASPRAYQHLKINITPDEINEVHCITESSLHTIVVGTAGNGIVTFDNTKPGHANIRGSSRRKTACPTTMCNRSSWTAKAVYGRAPTMDWHVILPKTVV